MDPPLRLICEWPTAPESPTCCSPQPAPPHPRAASTSSPVTMVTCSCSWTSHDWDHTGGTPFLAVTLVRFFLLVAYSSSTFIFIAACPSAVWTHRCVFIHFTVDWYLSCFWFYLLWRKLLKAFLYIFCVCVDSCKFFFLRYKPRSIVSGLHSVGKQFCKALCAVLSCSVVPDSLQLHGQ